MDRNSARINYHKNKISNARNSGNVIRGQFDDGVLHIQGYASATGNAYPVADFLGQYFETVERGAFAKTLADGDDVRLLINHDGIPLARTGSGTMSLIEVTNPDDDPLNGGNTGLWCDAKLDLNNPQVKAIQSALARRDLQEMSFAFSATRDTWSPDAMSRSVSEVKLYDVSLVTYPANPLTSVSIVDTELLEALSSSRNLERGERDRIVQLLEERAAMLNTPPEAEPEQVQTAPAVSEVTPTEDEGDDLAEPDEPEEPGTDTGAIEIEVGLLARVRLECARVDAVKALL